MSQTAKRIPIQVSRLANGLSVATVRLPHLARAHLAVGFRGGPCHEDDATWGLSHFLEHMVFRGTRRHRDARAVALSADAFGGEVGGGTYRDRVIYDTRHDVDALDDALELMREMLFFPRLQGLDIERRIIREELLETLDDDGQEIDADNVAFADAFVGHPLSRSIDGTLESLAAFTPDGVRAFHRRAYGPEHTVVVAAGPFAHRAVKEAVSECFGGVAQQGGPPVGVPVKARRRKGRMRVVRTDASQTTVRLVFPCPGLHSPDRHALSVLARILDDGPASRFQAHLIDELGLAYELWASADFHADHGVVEIGAQVAHDRVGELVEAVVEALERAKSRVPSGDELARVKARHRRDLLDLRDASAHTAERVARAVLFGLEPAPDADLPAVEAVTGKAVKAAARSVFRAENANLVLVGLPRRADAKAARKAVEGL